MRRSTPNQLADSFPVSSTYHEHATKIISSFSRFLLPFAFLVCEGEQCGDSAVCLQDPHFINNANCECKAGYKGTTENKEPECMPCETGKYSTIGELVAEKKCWKCEAGKYNPNPGSPACAGCAAGKFSSAEGARYESTCEPCAAGKFSGISSPSCLNCTRDSHSGPGKETCSQCPSGKHIINPATSNALKACNETNGCSLDPCPENNDCVDIKSKNYTVGGPVRRCIYNPPNIIEKEVSIEGLGKTDFPMDLSFAFNIQHFAFMVLYALLAIMILVQIVAVEGGLGKAGVVANR